MGYKLQYRKLTMFVGHMALTENHGQPPFHPLSYFSHGPNEVAIFYRYIPFSHIPKYHRYNVNMIISHCTPVWIGKYKENHDEPMDSELAYLHPEKLFHVLGISIAPAQGMLRGQDFRCPWPSRLAQKSPGSLWKVPLPSSLADLVNITLVNSIIWLMVGISRWILWVYGRYLYIYIYGLTMIQLWRDYGGLW